MLFEPHPPQVSVIITTLRRPHLVTRAIRSVLAQTFANYELIVIVDGPDPATVEALADFAEPRARVVVLPENVGLGDARNAGVSQSRGEWVAFLDDDDEWHPEKLAKQIASATKYRPQANFVATRFEERTAHTSRIRPKSFPEAGEPWSEAFYCNRVLLLPSTFLVKRSLMLELPFTRGLRRHEDADWLLRAHSSGVIQPVWVEDSLAIYHCEATQNRLSTHTEWRGRYQWYADSPRLITPKALPYYIGMLCIPEAQTSPNPVRACTFLLWQALKRGRINIKALGYLLMTTFSTRAWRTKMRDQWPLLQQRAALRSTKLASAHL